MTSNSIAVITSEQARAKINALLATFFDERSRNAQAMAPAYARLWQSTARLNQAGGKRLRPYMALLSYQICNGNGDISQAAAAWELLHLCMLIHDDIIDEDYIRYGVDNVAGEHEHIYEALEPNAPRRKHLATSAAILAGDVALSSAHQIILSSSLSSDQKVIALQYITEATFVVAGGELLDTESVLYDSSEVDSLAIARYKTASYSFVGPLCMGAALAGAGKPQLALLRKFGIELGCAYQLIDDLLGVYGDPDITGKSIIGDIREGKRTYLLQQAYQLASEEQKATLDNFIGKQDLSLDESKIVADLLNACGAKKAVQDQIDTHIAASQQILEQLRVEYEHATELSLLIDIATKRQY